ncbi:MAG: 1,4-alpha-glucan branching protein GlgB [Candidatus Riflebacteria bacterium]|nr:1,4-alpha-glucan branching protein GlgB [Candidatus Riflebacteria bacterium]
MKQVIDKASIEAIIATDHHDPFQILGAHQKDINGEPCVVVRAFLPDAVKTEVVEVENGKRHLMTKLHDQGFFEVVIPDKKEVFAYRLKPYYESGLSSEFYDSYAFMPTIGEMDQYLFSQGNHHELYNKLGAHISVQQYFKDKLGGVAFAVWAPNARRVSVIGDFNSWDGRRHVMRALGSSGIWEIFVPGLSVGQNYKFEVKTKEGYLLEKADPYAFYAELRPKTASKVYDISGFEWTDSDWMEKRGKTNWRKEPVSIFECHLGSFTRNFDEGNRFLTYRELAPLIAEYVLKLGYTHLELMPITEHPLDISWGYQVTSYFAPTSRFGSPKDFMYFVNYMHENGIGVILDWVPAHFPKDAHGLAKFDGTPLYEHSDPREGEHKDWGTLIFNFGRNEVKNFLISSALFWMEKYHIDGIRVDAVASMLYRDYSRKSGEWVPNKYGGRENLEAIEFLKYLNDISQKLHPGVLCIAEESTAFPGVSQPCQNGGLSFNFKWNMGWMNDTLSYFKHDPVYRKYHHNDLTFPLVYAFSENFIYVLSHDEVVHGKGNIINKMPGDFWQKFANVRLLYSMMWTMPGKKLLFMGTDFGQWNEWDSNQSLDWYLLDYDSHSGLQRLVTHLNYLYKSESSLHLNDCEPYGFEWISFDDVENSTISWLRRGENNDDVTVYVANFTPVPRQGYRLGVPQKGYYKEILNSDSEMYFGSNIGNFGGCWSEDVHWNHKPQSISINLPPLALVGFKLTE